MSASSIEALLEQVREPGSQLISPKRMAELLHVEPGELATLAGVHRNTLRVNPGSPKLQTCFTDLLQVLAAGSIHGRSQGDTVYWLRNHTIAALGHKSPMDLVRTGRAQAILDYLTSIESGYIG